MTRQETGIIMDILTTAYPAFYASKRAPDVRMTLSLWAEMFADDDVAQVSAAVKALIATKTDSYPPSIGAVKDKLYKLKHPVEMTEQEAWAHVERAIRNSAYNSEREFDRLPKAVKDIVHHPAQLKAWAMMDEGTVQSVVASNLQRSYRASVSADREADMLPTDVKELTSRLSLALSAVNR